ncbi:E3 ubiquitin-protein ligase AMFR [Nymphon striatum]|nr:E3 ubiquitin-protein ligase AMFR [Nymphon striatum]
MPFVSFDRIPVPSLQTYTATSVLVLAVSILYAAQATSSSDSDDFDVNEVNLKWMDIFYFIKQDHICVWTLFNMGCCCLLVLGKIIQNAVFGELRVSEQQTNTEDEGIELHDSQNYRSDNLKNRLEAYFKESITFQKQASRWMPELIYSSDISLETVINSDADFMERHMKDKFWNFIFYKFIFIVGIINVKNYDETLMWCSWFSVIGFIHILTHVCRDRCDYVCFSPVTTRVTHIKLISLLFGLFTAAFGLFIICMLYQWTNGLNTFMFMAVEFVLLMVRIIQIMVRYGIYFREIMSESVWEDRSMYIYYSELRFELAALVIDFIHHMHMLFWSNIFLSMATLIICMQLRYMFNEMQRKLKRHNNYLRIVKHMEENYPMATPEEINENCDECAICWEKLETARKLPCNHLFHNTCLQSWLEQDPSCPTCRKMLTVNQGQETNNIINPDVVVLNDGSPPVVEPMRQATTNHFHFDGSRYISWFPSFSVEVTRRHPVIRNQGIPALETSQLDTMLRQVQQMFPNLPMAAVVEDLLATRSVELTIENILDGRLVAPNINAQNARAVSSPSSSNSDSNLSSTHCEITDVAASSNAVQSTNASTQPQASSLLQNRPVDVIEDKINSSHPANAGRFSKCANEREKMLLERKKLLLKNARKKYLSTLEQEHAARLSEDQSDEQDAGTEDHVRNLAYMAAQRRLNNQSNFNG